MTKLIGDQCDRTKPCSACCASGCPSECHFSVGDGSDFAPIQQSYEIRELRLENKRLREQLLDTSAHQMEQDIHQSKSDRFDMITKGSTYGTSTKRQRLVVKYAPEKTSNGFVSLVEVRIDSGTGLSNVLIDPPCSSSTCRLLTTHPPSPLLPQCSTRYKVPHIHLRCLTLAKTLPRL
jgi:hypothetical protein